MVQRTLRTAILGTGFISDFHRRALSETPDVQVVAVCDSDGSRAKRAAQRWNVNACYDSLPEMLHCENPDVVHILVPPPAHAECSLTCLHAGAHLFLEKPAATTSQDCERIARAAAAGRRTVGVNHNARFHPALLTVSERIRQCKLGAVEQVMACVNVPLRQLSAGQHTHWMFQDPLNILLEQAPHTLSQVQLLLGDVVSAHTEASGEILLKTGVMFYRTWQIALRCQRGTAQLFLSFGREFSESWLHVIGQDASAYLDLRRNVVQVHEKTRFLEPVDSFYDGLRNSWRTLWSSLENIRDYGVGFMGRGPGGDIFSATMQSSIRAFYSGLRSGSGAPVDINQARAVISACEKIVESAAATLRPAGDVTRKYAEQEISLHAANI